MGCAKKTQRDSLFFGVRSWGKFPLSLSPHHTPPDLSVLYNKKKLTKKIPHPTPPHPLIASFSAVCYFFLPPIFCLPIPPSNSPAIPSRLYYVCTLTQSSPSIFFFLCESTQQKKTNERKKSNPLFLFFSLPPSPTKLHTTTSQTVLSHSK